MSFHHLRSTLIPCLSFVVLTGCGYDPTDHRPASVEVTWSVGGSTCSERGIATVQVTLSTPKGVEDTITTACQMGRVNVDSVPAGTYDIRVDGYPSGSTYPTYGGNLDGVPLHPGDNQTSSIEMAEKPGALDITWRFDDGSLCAFAGVETIELVLWDSHSNRAYAETLPCNPSLAQQVAEANEPTRVLFGGVRGILVEGLYAGPYVLRALAYGPEPLMGATHWALAEPAVTHAQIGEIELTFQPCDVLTPCGQ